MTDESKSGLSDVERDLHNLREQAEAKIFESLDRNDLSQDIQRQNLLQTDPINYQEQVSAFLVQLRNGASQLKPEVLFMEVGKEQRVSDVVAGENSTSVVQQLNALHDLARQGISQYIISDELLDEARRKISVQSDTAHYQQSISEFVGRVQTSATKLSLDVFFKDVGTVQHIGNGVATLSGLRNVRTDELVEFPTGVQGLVLNLERDTLDVILLGEDEGIRGGDMVVSTGNRIRVPVGQKLIGRVVNPLGEPMDDKGPIVAADYWFMEREAPGIVRRSPVNEPLQTGNKMIDALLPIGRGQRELILGDRQTGKTSLVIDTIINQKEADVDCVYVAIGQKKSSVLSVIETLKRDDALQHTAVVFASPDDPPALRYLAPFAGCTIAEYLLDAGRDVLIIFDDLSKHADAYRELSLLLRRSPGREAYPGDIFYLHSRLLERACKLSDSEGGGSLTALPIVEIQKGNVSAYIPTNLISITDGQIILDLNLFNKGIKPAIDIGRSVSRVGGAAQSKAMRAVSGDLRLELAQYEEVARFAQFGTEVDQATQNQIDRGARLQRILLQGVHHPISMAQQVVILYCALEGYMDDVLLEDIRTYEERLIKHFESKEPKILTNITREGRLSEEISIELREALERLNQLWLEGK